MLPNAALPNTAPAPYVRHRPELTLLYQVIEHHLPEFTEHLRERGHFLPKFVFQEFYDYLKCGRLEHGFVRVKCNSCRNELLVAFSCKHRGFCPSCGGRRMVDTAAHLVDRVLPVVPVRQWVLSFPYPLRLLYSTHPQALTRTLKIVLRAIETHLIRKAGLTRSSGARSGAITFIQRFGSALNLNVHLHMLIPDGVYTCEHGKPRFHTVAGPSHRELPTLLNRIIRRISRQLTRDGLLAEEAEQAYLDLQTDDTLDQFGAASLQYRVILGPNTGSRVLTLRNPASATSAGTVKPFTVARDGFSLNAAVSGQAHQRNKLERLCRYVARPPLALERLSVTDEGKLRYALKHPYSNGTTHFLFEPLDLLARLAALVPRPRVNMTRYHGVFAPNSTLRAQIVPGKPHKKRTTQTTTSNLPNRTSKPEMAKPTQLTWAQRLKRAFEFDVTVCPLCGGTLRVIARALARQHRPRHHRQDPYPHSTITRAACASANARFIYKFRSTKPGPCIART